MLQTLKFTKEDAENSIFIGDLHINQNKEFLLKGRTNFTNQNSIPFNTPKEHDDWLWDQLEKYVNKDTIIFNTGDTIFNDPKGIIFNRLAEIECKHHYLLWGNHNSGAKTIYKETAFNLINQENIEIYPLEYKNITFVGHNLEIHVKEQQLNLGHFPQSIWHKMTTSQRKVKSPKNTPKKPSIHIMGHTHGTFPETTVEHPLGKKLDVGVDNAISYGDKFCFTYKEIIKIMEKKKVHILDQHGKSNTSFT